MHLRASSRDKREYAFLSLFYDEDKAVTELETYKSGFVAAEKCVIAKDIHGVRATSTNGMLKENLHT